MAGRMTNGSLLFESGPLHGAREANPRRALPPFPPPSVVSALTFILLYEQRKKTGLAFSCQLLWYVPNSGAIHWDVKVIGSVAAASKTGGSGDALPSVRRLLVLPLRHVVYGRAPGHVGLGTSGSVPW